MNGKASENRDGAGSRARQAHAADHRHHSEAAGADRRARPCSTGAWTASPAPASRRRWSTCTIFPSRSRPCRIARAPRIVISDESGGLLDSAGGIVKALPELGKEPFYILNADTFWIDRRQPNLSPPRPCMGSGENGYSADARRSRTPRPATPGAPIS